MLHGGVLGDEVQGGVEIVEFARESIRIHYVGQTGKGVENLGVRHFWEGLILQVKSFACNLNGATNSRKRMDSQRLCLEGLVGIKMKERLSVLKRFD